MIRHRRKTVAVIFLAVVVVLLCALDLSVELGVAGGVLYILPVWLAFLFHSRRELWIVAIVCSVLTVAGYWLSPGAGDYKVLANRGLALFAIWLTATLCARVKAFEQQIDRARHEFQDLYDNSPDFFATVNAATALVEQCNDSLAAALGMSKSEIVGRSILDFYAVDCEAEALATFQKFQATGAVHNAELRLRGKDGTDIDVILNESAQRDDEGRIVRSRSVWSDISDIRRLEWHYRATIEAALDAVVTIDDRGFVSDWNPQAERIFDWPRDEALGKSLADLIVPEARREEHRRGLERFLATGVGPLLNQRLELTALRRSGEEFPIELTILPLQLSEGFQFSAFVRDITDQKQLEQAQQQLNEELERRVEARTAELAKANQTLERRNLDLQLERQQLAKEVDNRRHAEERVESILEAASVGMMVVDRNGLIVSLNAQTEELFGYDREQLKGQSVQALVPERFRLDHPTHVSRFFDAPQKRQMEGRELLGLHKDGHEFPVEIGLSPVETDEGLFVLCAINDVSERHRMETAQRELNEALEQSNLELQQFAYIASHDLQTPLRGIAGFSRFLQSEYHGKLDSTADDYIERIVDGCQRMQALISDLLAYSRVESRRRPFESNDLAMIFDDTVVLLNASISDSQGKVTRGKLPTVRGDASQLSQLLQNLIENGLKYHGEQPPTVHATAEPGAGYWTIAVRDNGIGIAAEHREKIFEIFRRLHTQRAYPGTGIGLAVCRRIVRRHGGRIWVESSPGKGSTFYFTVPADEPGAASVPGGDVNQTGKEP